MHAQKSDAAHAQEKWYNDSEIAARERWSMTECRAERESAEEENKETGKGSTVDNRERQKEGEERR